MKCHKCQSSFVTDFDIHSPHDVICRMCGSVYKSIGGELRERRRQPTALEMKGKTGRYEATGVMLGGRPRGG